jgi:hypothetical protein
MRTKPFYRYVLHVEIPATEVAILVDALDGEAFSLRDRIGRAELLRQLESGELAVDATSEERWPGFQKDIETLSVYLSAPLSGREMRVEPGPSAPVVEGWLVLALRGASERVALDIAWDEATESPVERGIDKEAARTRWKALPAWVRASLEHRQAGLGPA